MQDVAVGSDGDVWGTTERSVSRFDGEEWTTRRAGREFRDGRVGAVATGEDCAAWVLMQEALLQQRSPFPVSAAGAATRSRQPRPAGGPPPGTYHG